MSEKHSLIHVMVDLETLSTNADARVLSVALVPFFLSELFIQDSKLEESHVAKILSVSKKFYKVMSQKGQERRHISFSTLDWWQNQEDEAKEVLDASREKKNSVTEDVKDILDFLEELQKPFLESKVHCVLWGNGSSFDNPILRSLLNEFDFDNRLSRLWSYKHDACYRTLLNQYKILEKEKPEIVGFAHHALNDAMFQAKRMLNVVPEEVLTHYSFGSLLS